MNEIPDFLKGIDPDTVRDLDRLMASAIDSHHNDLFALNRQEYFARLNTRTTAISTCLANPTFDNKLELLKVDNLALLDFLIYIDRILDSGPSINKPYYLNEAISMADNSQTQLNHRQTGLYYVYEPGDLRTKIANALSLNTPDETKFILADMYTNDLQEVIVKYVTTE